MPDDTTYREACELKYTYAFGLDGRDWELYRSVLADDLVVDFRGIGYRQVMQMTAGAWVAEVRKLMDGLDVSHHQISACLLSADNGDPDEYAMRSYVTAQHVLRTPGESDRLYQIGGWYEDQLRRIDGALRFTRITFSPAWSSGDPAVMKDAARRAQAGAAE